MASLQSMDIVRANTLQMARLLGVVYLLCFLVLLPCTVLFSRSLTRPIARIITSLELTSRKVSAASNQVSESSQQLAEGASEQAASLEETSASLKRCPP